MNDFESKNYCGGDVVTMVSPRHFLPRNYNTMEKSLCVIINYR